jgi:hypothetical protein
MLIIFAAPFVNNLIVSPILLSFRREISMKLAPTLVFVALAVTAAPARAQTHNVALTWTASADAAANPSLTYNIYRSSACSGTFAKLNTAPVAATTYLDSAVLPGTYCYQATAVLAGVESVPSNQAVAVVPAPLTLTPGPPPSRATCAHRGPLIGWIRCVASRPKKPRGG